MNLPNDLAAGWLLADGEFPSCHRTVRSAFKAAIVAFNSDIFKTAFD